MFTRRELAAIVDLCRAVGAHDLLLRKVQIILENTKKPPQEQTEAYLDEEIEVKLPKSNPYVLR